MRGASNIKKGFTQEALAASVGVTRQTIIAVEKGKFVPSVKLVMCDQTHQPGYLPGKDYCLGAAQLDGANEPCADGQTAPGPDASLRD